MNLNELADIESIKTLKYRYMRALDTQDWSLMANCFAEDIEVWYNSGLYSMQGRDEVVSFLPSVVTPGFFSSHLAVHPEIELQGTEHATGIWRMQEMVYFAAENATLQEPHDVEYEPGKFLGDEQMSGAGYYYDEYVKSAGRWYIQRMGYNRIYTRITKALADPQAKLKLVPQRGRRIDQS